MVKSGPPKSEIAAPPPQDVVAAAYELVAQALREKAGVYNLTLHDLTHSGTPIGTWEVSVRRIDE